MHFSTCGLIKIYVNVCDILQVIAQINILVFHYDSVMMQATTLVNVATTNVIDLVFIDQIDLLPSFPPSPSVDFNGSFGIISLTATFQVICAPNFFGNKCDMQCEHRNDTTGHFTCDPVSGMKICLEGYQNVETNCTESETVSGKDM